MYRKFGCIIFVQFFLLKYRQYEVKDYSRKQFLNLRLCDTCGFQEESALNTQEFVFILSGHLPDCYQVNNVRIVTVAPWPSHLLCNATITPLYTARSWVKYSLVLVV